MDFEQKSLMQEHSIHCQKKVTDFPVPSRGMSQANLSLAGKNLIIPGQGEFGL
jgi:hypothetical protein